MVNARPALRKLAEHLGILSAYVDQSGVTRETGDRTQVALLAGMGLDASTEAAAGNALEAIIEQQAQRLLPAVRVVQETSPCSLPVAQGEHGKPTTYEVEIKEESGTVHHEAGRVRRDAGTDRVRIKLPRLPSGYHRLRLSLTLDRGGPGEAEQLLIVTPQRCCTPADCLGDRRVFGLLANLYTLRSARNWGFGDLSDLHRLVDYAAEIGAAFVGVNPLHTLNNRGEDISPYSPVSRLYRNPLYLDITAIPELHATPVVEARLRTPAAHTELAQLRAATHIDYERVAALKWPLLETLHRTFAIRHRDGETPRGRAYRSYLAREGEPLIQFGTFLALQRYFAERGIDDWRRWPAKYRSPQSSAVEEFRAAHREAVDFHCYVQFELDRQLATVAAEAATKHLAIGVYQDLAIGSSASGSDAWAFPELFLPGLQLGAPPDNAYPEGQNWGLPVIDPRRLAADGYEYWILLLRALLRHSGALRIDHVMGLFRQFWIPTGAKGSAGSYVRFPASDLLGILALESRRAGALVIGEDLGTLPRGFSRTLERWGILSTRVLYLGRTARGTFWPARAYPRRALVAAGTHDMVPLAGFWEGEDLAIRHRVGILPDAAALNAALVERARERQALVRRLKAEAFFPPGTAQPSGAELRGAVHGFLSNTPAALVGVTLDDLTGEVTPVNQPSVGVDAYPSWSRRMRLPFEAFSTDLDVGRSLALMRESARCGRGRVGARREQFPPDHGGRLLSRALPPSDVGEG